MKRPQAPIKKGSKGKYFLERALYGEFIPSPIKRRTITIGDQQNQPTGKLESWAFRSSASLEIIAGFTMGALALQNLEDSMTLAGIGAFAAFSGAIRYIGEGFRNTEERNDISSDYFEGRYPANIGLEIVARLAQKVCYAYSSVSETIKSFGEKVE
ncbi:hypothetical protein HOF78_01350 [Candidatus Woesearchaeota archaeon]|jgi:hypothetical protein|nr:hypothetical protein [Candidatus Woesearchaeota archaeon]MBT6044970.1 hypothetical protein [Candidatus Woesearchaeota archaeon]